MKKAIGPSFMAMGLVFLVIGFIQQDMTLSFESGMFNLGLIFTLGGLAQMALDRKRLGR